MSAPAAITASLVDVRNINTEKSVKLTLHVPAELAGAVFAAFGWPTATAPVPVALARLQPVANPDAVPAQAKERTPFSDLPYAQQAAMRCNEPEFWKYCEENSPGACETYSKRGFTPTQVAAELVRSWCRVESRAQIKKGQQSGDNWESLEAAFFAWSRGMR